MSITVRSERDPPSLPISRQSDEPVENRSLFGRLTSWVTNWRRNTALRRVQADGLELRNLSARFQDDEAIVEAAIENNGLAFQVASERLRGNPRLLRAAMSHTTEGQREVNGFMFRLPFESASFELRNDPTIIAEAVSRNPQVLRSVFTHRVSEVVERNGLYLRYASRASRNNFEIVSAAVRNNERAVQYASLALQNDPRIIAQIERQRRFQELSEEMHSALQRIASAFGSGQGEETFSIAPEDVDRYPLQTLNNLYPHLQNGFPKIEYIDSPGSDVGGLSRDFVTRLMGANFDPEKGVLQREESDGKIIPLLEDGKADHIAGYQAIGALFARAFEGTKRITTGNYFHPICFQMIHSLADARMTQLPDHISRFEDIPQEIVDKLLEVYAEKELHISREHIEKILQGNIPKEIKELGYEKKEDFFNSHFKQMALASAVISQSMFNHLQSTSLTEIRAMRVNEFATKIEGGLSREQIRHSLQWTNVHARTRGYLLRWLNECTDKKLETFVWAISGSRTLAPDQELTIECYDESERLPSYHTCFFKMDLPSRYPNYDTFKQKLELSLSSAPEGMSLA